MQALFFDCFKLKRTILNTKYFQNYILFNKLSYLIFTITANGMGIFSVGRLVSPHRVGTQ